MGAPAARVAELARHWQQAGHDVTVLTGFPNHPTGVVATEYRSRFRRLVIRERIAGVNVVRTWLLPLPNRKTHERMLNYSSFCLSSATTGLFLSRPDVVIATSPQLLVSLAGYWLARRKHVPLVFEVRDLWPESLAAVGMGNHDSLLHRSLARLAGFLYEQSQHVVVVTPAFKEHLINRWRLPAHKISVVENGVETDLFSPASSNSQLRRELDADGRFLVSYIGTIGIAHGLDTLLDAAHMLQSAAPQVAFLLLGEGADKERIKRLAASRHLNNIIFLDQQPRARIPSFISASDACLVLLKKTEIFKTVIPTKMLEFMSCSRPLILGVDGQARTIVEQAQAGLVVEPENGPALANAILRLSCDRNLCERLGRNGRRYIVENCSRQKTATEYLQVLESLLCGTRHRQAAAA
jgi:putative colanic acid biosynthesis glycosyltransferase WcaI